MKRVGILGGSFNPVHIGHLMVASYVCQVTPLDEVWLSLSPANPLKSGLSGASDNDRLAMLKIAVEGADSLKVCDAELSLPRPSYTLTLLDSLAGQYPDCNFRLIIGSDNWLLFNKWRNPEVIRRKYGVIVYPRPGYEISEDLPQNVELIDSPTVNISSTFAREAIKHGIDMNYFLPSGVYKYIKEHKLYGIL